MARKVGLTRDDVAAAAVAVVESNGLEGLSLAAVAAHLGIRPPSLYAHVDGLDGLRRVVGIVAAAMLGDALSAALRAAGDPVGPDSLAVLGRAYRAFARAHPGLYDAMLPAPDPVEDPDAAAVFAGVAGIVGRAVLGIGVHEAEVVHIVRAWRAALHGFVDLELRGGFGLHIDTEDSFEALLQRLAFGVPTFAVDPDAAPITPEMVAEANEDA